MTDRQQKLEQFVKERDEMLMKCDITALKRFVLEHSEYYNDMFIKAITGAPNDLLEMTLHKMIVNCTNLPFDFRQKSADWLLDRGLKLDI